ASPDTARVTSDERQVTSDDDDGVSDGLVTRHSSLVTAVQRLPLRGCMLPTRDTTEDDIETLHRWGATMARFQICRGWTRRDANQDLEDYAAWVDSRLDNLADVLRWAEARGMKIVLDLHVVPGGRGAKDRENNMLHDDRFAEAFLDTWRRIATRFKGDPALYGYDLWNEPEQHGRARNDYWTLQRRAAEIVRAIDPDTPIIVESNNSSSAATYSYLSPFRMDNVIYQIHVYVPSTFTHQGINGYERGAKWPDPEKGWDKEFLRKALEPVREFEARHHAKIYVGEFSAIAWAEGAENYLRDCIDLFEEYGWDWTYHAFREWSGWSVEHEGPDAKHLVPSEDNPRKRALLDGFARGAAPAAASGEE
ncbi:MAG: cellulase family glycosylhydrolase, partial [Kiritimatiellae bacterium]|nr:cellulase family glycosylhydrolase [Kiritimatiellia bacterium]